MFSASETLIFTVVWVSGICHNSPSENQYGGLVHVTAVRVFKGVHHHISGSGHHLLLHLDIF